MPLPSSVGNHACFALSSKGVVPVLVRLISLTISFGFSCENFVNSCLLMFRLSSTDQVDGASQENFSRSQSAHFVVRLMMASMCSWREKIYCSSAAIATPGLIRLRLSAINCALASVLLMIINLFISLWTNSKAIHLAVPHAPSMTIVFPDISSHISLNLSVRLSQYHAASELYPCISSPKCATKFVDCIASATGSIK